MFFNEEKVINKKIVLRQTILALALLFLVFFILYCVYSFGRYNVYNSLTKSFSLVTDKKVEPVSENIYADFLPDEYAFYIIELCDGLDVDEKLVISILLTENFLLDPEAINRNSNGTVDCGLFQLNDKYAYTTFKESFWMFDKLDEPIEFEIFNWQHNTFVAVSLIKDLCKTFGENSNNAIAAYNCGTGRVLSGSIPTSTKEYVKKVNSYYTLLKGKENG